MRISLAHIREGLALDILGEENTLIVISEEECVKYGEAGIQLLEGCSYEYQFTDTTVRFKENSKNNKIVSYSKFGKHKGYLNPNIYVGTHALEIENFDGVLPVEVRSVKSEYRADYRHMLESITEKCTDLIMQIDSPVSQHFETNFDTDSQTLYQRFSFVKALIDSKEFEEAVQKIVSSPSTRWVSENEDKDIRSIRRFSQKNIRQLITKTNRIKIPDNHFLHEKYGMNSVPVRIESIRKKESIDTPENRFVKHALEEFLYFCENCEVKFEKYSRAKLEANILTVKISNLLNQSFFKEISRPESLKLNSPVLQRKSGYREVLNAWLKFDLAAKLIWHGGDNVYDAGKKDIATLYEYWLFFTLLDLLEEIFDIEPKSIEKLIQYDNEEKKLSLNLKQGTAIALKGVFKSQARSLNIQFSYNRSFGGGKTFPDSGSYTTTLRPDYTLSIWPEEIKEAKDAEKTELITHIHFDAKYKVSNFYELISKSKEEELSEEENKELIKEEEEEIRKGTFKNQDLLKMHAYKDAIRRTGGAYVLYPGVGKDEPFRGFHELIPGLGAFVIKPTKEVSGREELKQFIEKVIDNFIDRASQREYTAVKVYDIHKEDKKDYKEDGSPNILSEPMPEFIGNEKLIPDETFVLVGFSKNEKRTEWYNRNGKYNFRMDEEKGELILEPEVVNAKYLLLRKSGDNIASDIYKITSKGPRVYSKEKLTELDYPHADNPKDYYLVIDIEKVGDTDFKEAAWEFRKMQKYKETVEKYPNPRIGPGIPFTVSLKELMQVKIK